MNNADDPKQKFVETAHRLFAERGYYGVSLADVAKELGLTKQAIIYHFKTKEALYGAVLEQLAERLRVLTEEAIVEGDTPLERLRSFVENLGQLMREDAGDARLIARELLDNLDRAQHSRKWYLRHFLATSVTILRELPSMEHKDDTQLATVAYQLIGAINYFAISQPTLAGIWGEARLHEMQANFTGELLERFA